MSKTAPSTQTLAISVSQKNAFFGVFSSDQELQFSDRVDLSRCVSAADYVRVLNRRTELTNGYSQVVVCMKSADSIALPRGHFESTTTSASARHLLVEDPVGQSISILSKSDKQLYSALSKLFPHARHVSLAYLLADHLYPTTKKVAALHIDKGMSYYAIYDGTKSKVLYAGETLAKEDYLYIVLHGLQVAGVDPEEVVLKLSGDIYEDSTLYDLLKEYVKHIEFIAPQRLKLRTKLPDTVKQRYFELYAAATCV